VTVLPTSALDEHWPRVRQGLERIIAKHDVSWIPEHVYRAVAMGEAWIALLDGGFMVFSITPGDDRRGLLHVWAIEGKGYEENRAKEYAALESWCKEKGIHTIRQFGRRGWAKDPFWRFAGCVFEHEVR
jgi:hypothetical protein